MPTVTIITTPILQRGGPKARVPEKMEGISDGALAHFVGMQFPTDAKKTDSPYPVAWSDVVKAFKEKNDDRALSKILEIGEKYKMSEKGVLYISSLYAFHSK